MVWKDNINGSHVVYVALYIIKAPKGTKMTYCFRNVWKSELSKDSVTKQQGDFIWQLSNKLFAWIILDTLLFFTFAAHVLDFVWERERGRKKWEMIDEKKMSEQPHPHLLQAQQALALL